MQPMKTMKMWTCCSKANTTSENN